MNKFLKTLVSIFGIKDPSSANDTSSTDTQPIEIALSREDAIRILNGSYVPTKSDLKFTANDFKALFDPVVESLMSTVIDANKLIEIAPEIEQAMSIMIPSIFSPNDMFTTEFRVTVDAELDAETTSRLSNIIQDFFGDNLEFKTKLPSWVEQAMYTKGAKPIMILPHSVLNDIRDATYSLEHLSGSVDVSEITDKLSESIEEPLRVSNNASRILNNALDDLKLDTLFVKTNDLGILVKSSIEAADYEAEVKASLESSKIDFTKVDPSKLIVNKSHMLDLGKFIERGDDSPIAAVIELPYESVVPIAANSSPENHIGYFVMLDENGQPLAMSPDELNSTVASNYSGKGNLFVDKLFKAFYNNRTLTGKTPRNEMTNQIMSLVFQSYFNSAIKQTISSDASVDVKFSNYTIHLMFNRLLKQKKTTILFVPNFLMHYLAFQYNTDGTGKSKLENIKFPLALKLNYIIIRLIALSEAAVRNKVLNIAFDDTVPNPFEMMKTIKKEFMKKTQHGISYDPTTIISSVLDKQLTVVPSNLPGIDNFSIESDTKDKSYPIPDDSLLEELTNMYLLGLDIPPSLLNRLNEDEFAVSVVTNNLILSNKIIHYQRIIKKFVSDVIVTTIRYSKSLRDALINAVPDEVVRELGESRILNDILESIEYSMPRPMISRMKSQYEEYSSFSDIVDKVISDLFPDDIVDRDNEETIKVLRAHIKRNIISEYVRNNAAFPDIVIPEMDSVRIEDMADTAISITNIKKMLKEIKDKLDSEGSSGGGSSW